MINEPKTIFTTTAQRHKAAWNRYSIFEICTGGKGGKRGATAAMGGCDVSNPAGQGFFRTRGLAAVAGTALCLRVFVVKIFIQCNQDICSASKLINGILYLIDQTLQIACRRTSLPRK